jgi:hypothetical protein
VTRPPLRWSIVISHDEVDTVEEETRRLMATVYRGLRRCTRYPGFSFQPRHVDDIVRALQRCGSWTEPGKIDDFRAWQAKARRERDMYAATARRLRRQWWFHYRQRRLDLGQYRGKNRQELVMAVVRAKALAASVDYFGDNFAYGSIEAETIVARILGAYTLLALRSADMIQGRKPRPSLGGPNNPAIDVLHGWLALVLKKPPKRKHLARMLSPSRAGHR